MLSRFFNRSFSESGNSAIVCLTAEKTFPRDAALRAQAPHFDPVAAAVLTWAMNEKAAMMSGRLVKLSSSPSSSTTRVCRSGIFHPLMEMDDDASDLGNSPQLKSSITLRSAARSSDCIN